MPSADLVFIVPGFLGFEQPGNFGNFADRICSALRTHIEGKLLLETGVIPLESLPTSTFAERQRCLLDALSRELVTRPGVERIHLVGHSVGGIDAHLLSCAHSVDGAPWHELDPHDVRAKIRSVISLSTPHAGTCLAAAPGAGSLSLGTLIDDPAGAFAILQLVNKLLLSALHDVGAQQRAAGVVRETRKVKHFLAELLRWQGFLRFLTPDAMEVLYARAEPLPDVARRSFVTLAGRPRSASAPARTDGFFEELSRRSAGDGNGFTRHAPNVREAISRLRAALDDERRVIVSAQALAPTHVDAQTNDGLVNAARQLIAPWDPDELVAVVVADHFDVLGYYDRRLALGREGEGSDALVSGLLHSGSFFRDTEFFALYRRIGDVILEQCPSFSASTQPEELPPSVPKRARAVSRPASRRPSA